MSGAIQDPVAAGKGLFARLGELAGALAEYALLLAALPFRREGPAGEPKRVVVIAYTAMGDLLFFLPVLEALRAAWPKAHVVFVGSAYAAAEELLPRLGLVDEVWNNSYYDLWRWGHRRAVARRIAGGNFDVAIVGQATPLRGLARGLLKVPVRVGHGRRLAAPHEGWSRLGYQLWRLKRAIALQELERRLALNRLVWAEPGEHVVERNLRLLSALGLAVPRPEASRPKLVIPEEAEAFARRALPDLAGRPTIGLHVGAPTSGYAKIWPAERWGKALAAVAARIPARVAVFGGPGERETAAAFGGAFGAEFVDLAGKASLVESFACLRRCDLFLSNDTGMSKAAMVLGVPTVTAWGPVSRAEQGAVWDRERHAEVFRELPCSPCVLMSLPAEGSGVLNFTNCGHHDCLNRLEEGQVVEATLKQLQRLRRA